MPSQARNVGDNMFSNVNLKGTAASGILQVRSFGKYLVRRSFFSKALLTVLYHFSKNQAIQDWPGWAGTLFGIKVPHRTIPTKTPQPRGGANIRVIFELLRQTAEIEGDIAECGVFEGETLIPIACYQKQLGNRFSALIPLKDLMMPSISISVWEGAMRSIKGWVDLIRLRSNTSRLNLNSSQLIPG